MPPIETISISFGNWIAAFPVVYAMAGIAVAAASAVLFDWSVNKVRGSRLAGNAGTSRQGQVIRARA